MEKNRCAGCKYYRPEYSSSVKGPRMCHYLLDNGHGRARDGDNCLSYAPKRKNRLDKSELNDYDKKGDVYHNAK